jgi:arylsulfatase A-like enzyme
MHHRLGKWFDDEYQPDKPFFIFLNYMDAHFPYIPPLSSPLFSKPASWHKWDDLPHGRLMEYTLTGANTLTPKDINELIALYDEEIAYADRKIHELLEFFHASGLDENTFIIIAADHGELWGEHHMLCHESTLYEPLVRVPLIVKFRDRFGTGIDSRLVQSHDVYPTILEICGVEWRRRPAHNCRSLLEQDRSEPRWAVSELIAPRMSVILQRTFPNIERYRIVEPVRALQVGDKKLILDVKGTAELYDLANDPLETRNLASEQQGLVQTLRTQLEDWLRSFEHYKPKPQSNQRKRMTPKEIEALRALGYVD